MPGQEPDAAVAGPLRRTAEERASAAGETAHAELLQRVAARMPVMIRVMKLVGKRVMAEHAPRMTEIGEGQARVLHVLYEDGRRQVGELAERCGVADPTVSKMLKSLEHNGLIERRTDPENRRVVWVSLTAKGRSLFDEIQASFEQGMAQMLGGLSDEQLRDFLRTMDHLEQLLAGSSGTRPHLHM
jgi:DNA-binding MarR family transcriptional regulator